MAAYRAAWPSEGDVPTTPKGMAASPISGLGVKPRSQDTAWAAVMWVSRDWRPHKELTIH